MAPSIDWPSTEPLTVVIMAKPRVPGRVKTRMIPALGEDGAAAVHQAMFTTVAARLSRHLGVGHPLRRVVACAGGSEAAITSGLVEGLAPAWELMDQGVGDLGQRLAHVWDALGGGPVVFFGVDSPDVPVAALRSIRPALHRADLVLGPAFDGGYWVIAGRGHQPGQLVGIDWGTPAVYQQTVDAARKQGLTLAALMPWHDVDEPADLRALLTRAQGHPDAEIAALHDRLAPLAGRLRQNGINHLRDPSQPSELSQPPTGVR